MPARLNAALIWEELLAALHVTPPSRTRSRRYERDRSNARAGVDNYDFPNDGAPMRQATRDLSLVERDISRTVIGQVADDGTRDLLLRQLESAKVVSDLPGEAHLEVDPKLRSSSGNGPALLMIGMDPVGHEVTIHLVLSAGLLAVLKCFRSSTGEFSGFPSVESLRAYPGGYFRF